MQFDPKGSQSDNIQILSKTDHGSTLNRNHVDILQDIGHDHSQSLSSMSLLETVPESSQKVSESLISQTGPEFSRSSKLLYDNVKKRREYEHSQRSSPPILHQPDTHLLQKEHQKQQNHNVKKLDGKYIEDANFQFSSGSSQSQSSSHLQEEYRYQQNIEQDPEMHHRHHYTLPRQQAAILPGSHGRFSQSLSSTLPLYTGSELPDFDVADNFPEEVFKKTDATVEHSGVPFLVDKLANTAPMQQQIHEQSRGSLSPYAAFSSTTEAEFNSQYKDLNLPSKYEFLPDNSSTDTLNLKVLEEVFQEMINRKQSQRTNNKGPVSDQNIPCGNDTKLTSLPNDQSQSMHKSGSFQVLHDCNDSRLTYLPSGHPMHSSPLWNDIKSNSLPNAIPKTPASLGVYNTKVTFVHDNISSRPDSLASGRQLQPYITVSELSEVDSLTNVTYTPSVSVHSGYAEYTGNFLIPLIKVCSRPFQEVVVNEPKR